MKILFTGGSSFTGYWFAGQLASAGHDVTVVMRQQVENYADELRRLRVAALTTTCHPIFGVSFGDDRFLELIKDSHWDVLCHHAADARNYRVQTSTSQRPSKIIPASSRSLSTC